MLPQNRLKGKERITVEEFRKLKTPKAKYGNRKVKADGMTFDSMREYRRWLELNILQKSGHISDLKRQVSFDLGVCKYVADFTYGFNGLYVVEDVKGFKTAMYRMKKKLMKKEFGIHILET